MIKAILWDVDGTLLDFTAAERAAVRTGFARRGLGTCSDEMLAAYSRTNVKYWEALERGEMTKPEILVGRFREFFTLYGIDPDLAPAFNEDYQLDLGDTVVFQPGALETVKALKGRVLQCAVTNDFHVYRAVAVGSTLGGFTLYGVPARSSVFGFIHYALREFFAVSVSLLRGNMAAA